MDCLTHLDAYQKSWELSAADTSAWPTKIWGHFSSTAKGCEVHETGGSNMSLTFLAHFLRKEKKKQTVGNFCQNKMTIIQRTALKIFKYLNKCFRKKARILQTIFKWWTFFFGLPPSQISPLHRAFSSSRASRPSRKSRPGRGGRCGALLAIFFSCYKPYGWRILWRSNGFTRFWVMILFGKVKPWFLSTAGTVINLLIEGIVWRVKKELSLILKKMHENYLNMLLQFDHGKKKQHLKCHAQSPFTPMNSNYSIAV